jgi:hypothetical protein
MTNFDKIKQSPRDYSKREAVDAALIASTNAKGELELPALQKNLASLAHARVELDPAFKGLDPKEFSKAVKNWQDQYNLAMREALGLTKSMTVPQGLFNLVSSVTSPAQHGLTCSNPKQVNMSSLHNTLGGSGITCKKADGKNI